MIALMPMILGRKIQKQKSFNSAFFSAILGIKLIQKKTLLHYLVFLLFGIIWGFEREIYEEIKL